MVQFDELESVETRERTHTITLHQQMKIYFNYEDTKND
jgi:hypothetical protein